MVRLLLRCCPLLLVSIVSVRFGFRMEPGSERLRLRPRASRLSARPCHRNTHRPGFERRGRSLFYRDPPEREAPLWGPFRSGRLFHRSRDGGSGAPEQSIGWWPGAVSHRHRQDGYQRPRCQLLRRQPVGASDQRGRQPRRHYFDPGTQRDRPQSEATTRAASTLDQSRPRQQIRFGRGPRNRQGCHLPFRCGTGRPEQRAIDCVCPGREQDPAILRSIPREGTPTSSTSSTPLSQHFVTIRNRGS